MTRRFAVPLALLLALTPFLYVAYAGSLDLKVYRTGGYAWLHDVRLYSEHFADLVPGIRLPFTYPPLAAILFVGLEVLPFLAAEFFMNLASVAGLAATTLVVSWRLFGWNRRALLSGLGMATVAMAFEPVRSTWPPGYSLRPTPRSTGSGCCSIPPGSAERRTRSTSASRRCCCG